jgi:hypothetical protein
MKTTFLLIIITGGALLSGCATGNKGIALGPVGPEPSHSSAAGSAYGTLTVYSAYEVNADFNSRDPNRPEHSDYFIFGADGKLLKRIHNNSGTIFQKPAPVRLAAGKYRVVARANGYGYVSIPVVVGGEQNTVVHLDRNGAWPDKSVFNQANSVRLPDGQIVGWKSASSI